jgi:hypothetical protein
MKQPYGLMVKMYRVRARLDEAAMGFEVGGILVIFRADVTTILERKVA